MKKHAYLRRQGFTFIEVLVVTTIIAVLTMVGVTNFRVANQKAKDGRRQGDLQQIRAALELYRTDENVYPDNLGLLESSYIGTIPDDPLDGQDYYYISDGSTYTLCAALELTTTGACGGNSCGTATCNYQINNPL